MTLEVIPQPYTETAEREATRDLVRGLEQEIQGLEMTLRGKQRQLGALKKRLRLDANERE